jgi:hypothetical protein
MLECRLYAQHNILKDNFIGGTKDAIELLLAEGAAGSLYTFMLNHFANNILLLAITRELCKYDSSGNQRKTQIIIEFTIEAMSMASDSAGLNMKGAALQANDAIVRMKLAPSSLQPIQHAVDTSVSVVTDIKSLSNTWDPLLQKVKLFSEFVDEIAHVSGRVD